ncbi:MAG: murein hydrolase activator EnvC family protein [Chloroflexota bacterium]
MGRESATGPLLICSLLVFSVLCFAVVPVFAQGSKDEYRRLQRELRSQQKKLDSAKKTERSVMEDLRKTDEELSQIEEQLVAQRRKIRTLQRDIAVLNGDIEKNKRNLDLQRERLKKRLRALQRITKETDVFLLIITEEDPAEMLKAMRYLRDISLNDRKVIDGYLDSLERLNAKQKEVKALLVKLKEEEDRIAKLDGTLEAKKKERENLLSAVRRQKGAYERSIADLREASKRILKILRDSERREREARRKREPGQPPAKEEAQEEAEFAALKGTLPWPVPGSVMIHYGSQTDPVLNIPVFRSGIHIKASEGTPVKAVHGGKIVYADAFKGYGQLVILTHGGGYHTLYGNLGKIFSRNGAIIKENQAIGEVGESNALGTSGLYFEVRYRGKPLDPQQWLRK